MVVTQYPAKAENHGLTSCNTFACSIFEICVVQHERRTFTTYDMLARFGHASS